MTIPAAIHKGKSVWRLSKLEVDAGELFEGVSIKVASGMAMRAGKSLGKKFSCRSRPDGIWIYRVK